MTNERKLVAPTLPPAGASGEGGGERVWGEGDATDELTLVGLIFGLSASLLPRRPRAR